MEQAVEVPPSPLPVVKTEIKEEEPEDITQVFVNEEYEFPIKEESLSEEDPLADSSDQVNERVVKHEVEEEEEMWENIMIKVPVEQMQEDSSDASEYPEIGMVFSCKGCDVTFTSSVYLEKHKKICRGNRKPAVKVNPEEVTRNVQTLAKFVDGKKMYFCDLCNYKTKNVKNIANHLVVHTGAKSFQCEVCSKTFTRDCSLKLHKRIHSQDKPYKCSECSYAAYQAGCLKKHMTKHTGERAFACKQCTFTTSSRSGLSKHVKSHSEEKPFKCEYCEHKTLLRSNLKIHVQNKHSTEKPYACPHCEFKAKQRNNLNMHMSARHTDYKPFSCSLCEYKAAHRGSITSHMKHRHRDNIS